MHRSSVWMDPDGNIVALMGSFAACELYWHKFRASKAYRADHLEAMGWFRFKGVD